MREVQQCRLFYSTLHQLKAIQVYKRVAREREKGGRSEAAT